MTSQPKARYRWKPADILGLIALTAMAVFATRNAWIDILRIAWRDEESSHIFLVPLVMAWIIWVRRGRWRICYPVHRWVGPFVVLMGWLLSEFGYANSQQAVWHGGVVVIMGGVVLTSLGTEVLKRFFPAFLVLLFIVPVPGMLRQDIAIPLQERTAEVTHHVFQFLDVPIMRSGSILIIGEPPADMQIGIAEACNGLRMVFALALVSYAFSFGTPLRWYVRLIVVILSPVSAIICNVIRLVPTVWIYGKLGEQYGAIFHDYSGWTMLAVSFLILMGIIRLMRWALVPVTDYTLAYD